MPLFHRKFQMPFYFKFFLEYTKNDFVRATSHHYYMALEPYDINPFILQAC
jgi:hypothetical protein